MSSPAAQRLNASLSVPSLNPVSTPASSASRSARPAASDEAPQRQPRSPPQSGRATSRDAGRRRKPCGKKAARGRRWTGFAHLFDVPRAATVQSLGVSRNMVATLCHHRDDLPARSSGHLQECGRGLPVAPLQSGRDGLPFRVPRRIRLLSEAFLQVILDVFSRDTGIGGVAEICLA